MSVECKQCGKPHNRKKFCSNKCKDKFHNLNNPRGKFSHLAQTSAQDSIDDYHESIHPFSSEGLGQWDD